MRYLGAKDNLIEYISQILVDKQLNRRKYVFFDAFCGMGSVSDAFKDLYDIIINDILNCCTVFTQARLFSSSCEFKTLGFNPIDYFNSNKTLKKGFVYQSYSLGGSERMYFSEENAGRIDFFRSQIEQWKENGQIGHREYVYLLGCLLESVSRVSNTAGVYGAFLKHWDKRALKPIEFCRVPASNFTPNSVMSYNERIEEIIDKVECDILYLDPPYTQNQYGTQYHLLETIILDDNPSISKITGSRPVTPMRSDWSKEYWANIMFEKVVAKTKAKHIILSYNNDGFMTKDYIESILKRYGKEETYVCQSIDYKKYNNAKCQGSEEHCEYLFYIEKKEVAEVLIESPLNYQGSKTRLVKTIKSLIPQDIKRFVDAFGGGFNVGININVDEIIYNDINHFVKELIESFCNEDTYSYLKYISKLIERYKLSPENKKGYLSLREVYNMEFENNRDPKMLYTLLMYGFQQQIRFNGSHEFNNPFGSRYFNDKLLAKFISFSREAKDKNIKFTCMDYRNLEKYFDSNTFVYLDPPYLDASGTYNDGKRGFAGWTELLESSLLKFLDHINMSGVKFMLSYIANETVINWANNNNYRLLEVKDAQGRYNRRKEIMVLNY